MTYSGPAIVRNVVSEPSGTIAPVLLRVRSFAMSSGSRRYGASACAVTRNVRPKRLKSLTYTEPMYTCRVFSTSADSTPSISALVRSMSA